MWVWERDYDKYSTHRYSLVLENYWNLLGASVSDLLAYFAFLSGSYLGN